MYITLLPSSPAPSKIVENSYRPGGFSNIVTNLHTPIQARRKTRNKTSEENEGTHWNESNDASYSSAAIGSAGRGAGCGTLLTAGGTAPTLMANWFRSARMTVTVSRTRSSFWS